MKTRILFFLLGSAAATHAALTVAVYDFTGEPEVGASGRNVTTLITADLSAETNLVLLERAQLDKALSEQAFGVSGLVSADAAATIGQLTGAKVLVSGQVMLTQQDHLVIVANIIGTETGRLFAAKVEGSTARLTDLTAELSSKISQTITSQSTNLLAIAAESAAARQERIVKSVTGTNRPSVSVTILWPKGGKYHCATAEVEFGALLLKAGFPVVDAKSDHKSDLEITGITDHSEGGRQGGLFSYHSVIELKVQDRRTGNFITIDRGVSTATDASSVGADRSSQAQAVDDLAQRVLPLLAK